MLYPDQMDKNNMRAIRDHINNLKHYLRWELRDRCLDIPSRYQHVTMEDFSEQCSERLNQSLIITGPAGAGKTHLLCALARRQVCLTLAEEWPGDKFFAKMVSVSNLIAKIKSTFRPDSELSEEEMFADYANCAWLYLDDLGTQNATDWAYDLIYRLIDHRWNQILPIVVSSNFEVDELAEKVGERIVSRLLGMGSHIKLPARDLRLSK